MIPDGKKVVSDYLRGELDGVRVVGQTPDDTQTAWIRVTQLDDAAVGDHRADHLIEFLLQLDCYAGADDPDAPGTHGMPEARRIGREVRDALRVMPAAGVDDAVISGVRFLGGREDPDPDFPGGRGRMIRIVSVYMHPST